MKKTVGFAAIILCMCLLLSACRAAAYNHNTPAPTPATTTNANGFISEEQAIAAAEQHFGIEDGTIDEKTGYPMTYRIFVGASEQNPTYRVSLQWYVVDPSDSTGEDEGPITSGHWSTLDTVLIDAKTGAVIVENAE